MQSGQGAVSIGYGKRLPGGSSLTLGASFSGGEKSAGAGFGFDLQEPQGEVPSGEEADWQGQSARRGRATAPRVFVAWPGMRGLPCPRGHGGFRALPQAP